MQIDLQGKYVKSVILVLQVNGFLLIGRVSELLIKMLQTGEEFILEGLRSAAMY